MHFDCVNGFLNSIKEIIWQTEAIYRYPLKGEASRRGEKKRGEREEHGGFKRREGEGRRSGRGNKGEVYLELYNQRWLIICYPGSILFYI